MNFLIFMGLGWLLLGAAAPAERGTTCDRGIEDAHPKRLLACTTCHRGDGKAASAGQADWGM